MAWDPPAAFSVSEVVTASKMNQIKNSLDYLKGLAGAIVPEDVIAPVRNGSQAAYDCIEWYSNNSRGDYWE